MNKLDKGYVRFKVMLVFDEYSCHLQEGQFGYYNSTMWLQIFYLVYDELPDSDADMRWDELLQPTGYGALSLVNQHSLSRRC